MPFQKPRILTETEENVIRGKCLVAKASPEELMLLIGHFDLLIDKVFEHCAQVGENVVIAELESMVGTFAHETGDKVKKQILEEKDNLYALR